MEILKAIISLLWALFAIGTLIVLIIYFKSISTFFSAISKMAKEAGVIDWGKRGKYRRQLNKLMKATEAESQLLSESATEQPNVSPNSQEERIKQLEFNIGTLNKQLLGAATVAVTTSSDLLNSASVQFLENIREQALKDVTVSDADSDIVEYAYPLMLSCFHCSSFEIDNENCWMGFCNKHKSVHRSDDVCDDWTSCPKS